MRLLLALFLAAALNAQVVAVKRRQVIAAAGPTEPSFVSASNDLKDVDASGDYVLTPFTTSANQLVVLMMGGLAHGTACDLVTGVQGGVGGVTDTFTHKPSTNPADATYTCGGMYYFFNPTAGTYTIKVHSTASGATMAFSVSVFSRGSLTAAEAGGSSECMAVGSGSTITCSSGLTATVTTGLAVSGVYKWDNNIPSDNSSGFTVAAGSTRNDRGGIGMSYKIYTSDPGTMTPSWNVGAGGDPAAVIGVLFK